MAGGSKYAENKIVLRKWNVNEPVGEKNGRGGKGKRKRVIIFNTFKFMKLLDLNFPGF